MNKVILIGRIANDIDVKYTQTGKAVATFSIAVNRVATKGKEAQADFIRIVAWNGTAEACGNYMSKGSKVGICGRLQSRSYDKDGKKQYITEVIADNIEFLDSKKNKGNDIASSMGTDIPNEEVPF